MRENYDQEYIDSEIEDFCIYENEKWFYAEYHLRHTKGLVLLSDLSELEHIEEDYNW